jgi:uncharacterized protein
MIIARASLLALLVCWAFPVLADVAVPPLSGRVVDQTGTLTASDMSALTARLKDLEARKGSQLAVLIVPTTAPESIEQYSIRVAEAWKIGRKKIDDGVLLVVAKNDHKVRIEVGYGLEGALTDVTAKRIIDETVVPMFRSGDFAGGISLGVEWIIAVIDGEKLPAPVSQPHNPILQGNSSTGSQGSFKLSLFTLIVVILVALTLRTVLGRLIGSAIAGGVVATLVWYFAGSLETSAAMGGLTFLFTMYAEDMVWFGDPGWSSSRSTSDSGSGFSGGGGSFGGGGASGSW